MRTLKKTLSLVLVVAMVLGLCVVGASAYNKVEDFTDDVAKIGDAYYEAVGVLTGIGVIDGMTETAFEPQGNYTREQAAKIIAYMQLGKDKADSLKCTVAPFEDVAATRWSAGYLPTAVEAGHHRRHDRDHLRADRQADRLPVGQDAPLRCWLRREGRVHRLQLERQHR